MNITINGVNITGSVNAVSVKGDIDAGGSVRVSKHG